MREYCTSGSVRGAARKGSPYRGGFTIQEGGEMRARWSALSLIVLLVASEGGLAGSPSPPSAELRQAISIADAFLPSLSIKADEYKLVEAENMMNGKKYMGPAFWRLTYKSCGGRPPVVEPICKGGELFIGVDMTTRKASFIGAGE